ncbi:reverse transcriptase domain-containing protein [Tanacetum coccineum]|uniref:Reverse transcriptase domain-containing protein n=1 Tax=Tanacetum coccineum TaxID=301880 RepID=A0ABQ5ALL6_9ASTR
MVCDIESKSKVRYSRSRANNSRVSTDAPLSNSSSSNNSFEMQQIAASLEDKMTIKINVNQTSQVNLGANSGLSQQAQAYQVPSTPAPVTYSRFEAYTKANDATLNNLQKNLNDFKKEQQDFQNEQRNFQNMMLNMFQKQMGNNNTSSSGTLPSNTITNPRCEARAITTRSGLSYTPVPPIPPPLYDVNEPLTEKETEVTKDKVLPSTKDIQPPVIQKSQDPVKPVSSPISPEPSSAQVDNSPPSKEPSKKNRLPYPSRVEHEKKGENDKVQIQKFWEMFKKIHVDITLADALILVPKYQKMLKSLLSNKEKLNEMANTPVSETCSAIILKKLPEKLGDPGQFLIPCLPALQSTRMTLELANCSLCVPKGIARDVLVPVGKFTFPADFVVVDFECNYQVPLILGRPFLRTARVLIDVHGEELVIRDGLERIVFKPDGSQDNESIHMMDVYDDRVKDVCEPESNDDSATSAIVDEFESLLGDIIKQKEELKGISDPVARRKAYKEILIPIPRESKIGKDCDFPSCDDFQSFKTFSNPLFEKEDDFPSRNDESILKEEVHKETLKSYLNSLFEDDEENISIEVSKQISPKVNSEPSSEFLPKDDCDSDDDLFEIDSNNDEWKRILYGEDFERMNVDSDKIKDFDKTSSNVFKSLSDELEPGGSSHVERNDLDFHVGDVLFSTINEDKIFKPGIFDKDAFNDDKSSKELAPSKALLTLDVFDPLHPPLMDFNVTKAFFGFTFSILKIFSKKFFEPGIKNATEQLGDASIEIQAYTQALKKVEAQLVAHQQGQLWYEEKIRFMKIDLDDKTDVLTYHKKLLAEGEKEKEDLKAKIEKWHNFFKNLSILLNSQMSANDKFRLGFGDYRYDGILSYENEVLQSVFMNKESDLENQPLYDRFVTAEGMHVVPPPMTGNYMPSGPDIEIYYSQFTYGPKQSQASESETQTSDFDTCDFNVVIEKTHEYLPEPAVNEPKVVSQPKVWSDAPIIEEYESDNEDEHVSLLTEEQEHQFLLDSKHMTGNKTYLAEYQDFNGGPVAFGESKGYITSKVSRFVTREPKFFYNDSECLVLSLEFKLPDANQVLLRIPRQNYMYSFNLENIVPLED